jgi:hypothetical protein
MQLRILTSIALALPLLAPVGCGGPVKSLEGTITLDGVPVEGATIVFYPVDGEAKNTAAGSAVSDAQGHFTVVPGEKAGIPAGKYKVLVTKTILPGGIDVSEGKTHGKEMKEAAAMKAAFETAKLDPKKLAGPPMPGKSTSRGPIGQNVLPEKYASVQKTSLEVTIPAPDNKVELKLTKN